MKTTLTTAADALHHEEVGRTRAFIRTGWVVAIGVIAFTLALPGDRRIAIALLAVLGVAVLGSVWLYYSFRDPARYSPRKLTVLAVLCIICGQLGVMYVGFLTAAPVVTVLGLYFFCRTENLVDATAMYLIGAIAYGVEAALVISGKVAEPGFYRVGARVSIEAQLAGHFMGQLAYLVGFMMARFGRRASLASIEQLQEATRLAAQREEQVNELRQDLDRALKIGGPGRFTGHVAGAWELGNVLGRGAMGEVYEALHTTTGDRAAVKLLRRELLSNKDYVVRFLREVRAASALDSPHVVRVLDASTPEDPIPFLAMERMFGHSLGDLLRTNGTLTARQVVEVVQQVAVVLDKAREAGIVHRDIKPHNLFHTDDGVWKVLDFGIALLGESGGTLTQGGVVGTPGYMAPEQAKGELVDSRADIYALGAVIYRCLTGRVPFTGRDTPALLYAVVHQMPQRPGAIASVSPQIEAVLAVALAKSREARFQTAGELATAYLAADRGELSDELRQRARSQVRQHPWSEPDLATQEFASARK